MLQSGLLPGHFDVDGHTSTQVNEPSEAVNKVWLAIVAGLLIATSNSWLFHPQLKHSTYSAPWVHPGHEPGEEMRSI